MSEGMKKRMIVVLVIFFAVALGITGKLGYEQLFNASKLESGALNARSVSYTHLRAHET